MGSSESAERPASVDGAAVQDHAALLAALGAELLAKYHPYDAEVVLRYALTLDSTCFAARFGLAEALQAIGRSTDALSEFWLAYATARRAAPDSLILLAEERSAADRLNEPSSDPTSDRLVLAMALGFAASQRPKEAWLTGLVGQLFAASGLPAEALAWYRRAAAVDPGFEPHIAPTIAACAAIPPLHLDRVVDSVDLLDALRRMPLPAAKSIGCKPLSGGAQNTLIKLDVGERSFALRLAKFPSPGWHFYAEESCNAKAAHTAGVAPAIVYFDRADGTQLTEFIAGPMMTASSFADPARAAEAGTLYRRLHATEGFRGTFDILRLIETDGRERGAFSPPEIDDLPRLGEEFSRLRSLLVATRGPLRATHNDPIPQNFIAAERGLVLLDWQCSGFGDPYWDIGAFSAQVALPAEAEQAFFAAYFDPDDTVGLARTRLFKAICSYFWLGRALGRGAKAADQDWLDEALQSAKRFRAFLAEPVFTESVGILETKAA